MSYLSNKPGPRRLVVIGGGLAGWMTAAVLARAIERNYGEIQMIETAGSSGESKAVGTRPSFGKLCGLLGIDERDWMPATHATFKLGAQFRDWGRSGDRYFHGFGPCGARLEGVAFHQHWLRLQRLGEIPAFEEYSPVAALARAGRFAPPAPDRRSPFHWYDYAYHLDRRQMTAYLRRYALQRGVQAIAGDVVALERHPESALISALRLADGALIAADMLIDCSAERNGPLWRSLEVQFEDWRRWIPCDRALSITAAAPAELPPYSCFTAAEHGWQWQIPLQDSVERGYAYCSDVSTEAQLESALRAMSPDTRLEAATPLRFECGRPERFWSGNALLLGACRPGPLEATELHLLQSGITRFLGLFPGFTPGFDRASAQEYNRLAGAEHDRVRDFLALHFIATSRDDSPLWRHCRASAAPATLRDRLELFRHSGRLGLAEDDCFGEGGWLAVLLGQHVLPAGIDPLAGAADLEHTRGALQMLSTRLRDGLKGVPGHRDYLAHHGLLAGMPVPAAP
jgi:tryptophan halogenase